MSAWRKYLLLPRLIRLSRSAPRDRPLAWDRYWAGITSTGPGGEVLWDAGTDHEFLGYRDILLRHLDPMLPVVDVGCGHGSFTRSLAGIFSEAIGVDISRHAVARAADESAGIGNIRFDVRDMTAPGAAAGLVDGSANVFVRGVLHVLTPEDQAALAENLRVLAGDEGTVFLAETNFQGNPVEYVTHLGATRHSIPAPLERAIRGLPMPGHFGPKERSLALPPAAWDLLEEGAVAIETNPVTGVERQSRVPGYVAALRPRRESVQASSPQTEAGY
jgi:SAM-dependent methyltransferase